MNVISVDVGSSSVRLAIISFTGEHNNEAKVLASHKEDIEIFQDGCKFEQRSEQIWEAMCKSCRFSLKKANISPSSIKSIAFSATCSLVIEEDNETESSQGNKNNVIMWMDHRATKEASEITSSSSKALKQIGGVCSPEFSLAKLLWLKNNDPQRFQSATAFFELPDWLVFKCIGGSAASSSRSLCCAVCKWGYDADCKCHCDIVEFLDAKTRFGSSISTPGSIAGFLCSSSAAQLGLSERQDSFESDKENLNPSKVVVATSLIDAHAGMLAMLSVQLNKYGCCTDSVASKFCSLAGTSSCHMLLSKEPNFTHGVWGPYKDVVVDGYYLNEAGQSLTGKLIEFNIANHFEGKMRLENGEAIYNIIDSLNKQAGITNFHDNIHILPTFHGNRSPLANPRLKGGIYGMTAEGSPSLLKYYVATVESLIYELKLIVETMNVKLDNILVSGGLMKNTFYMQTLADALQCRVFKLGLKDVDFMIMGAGLVARHAALLHSKSTNCPVTMIDKSIENLQYPELEVVIYEPRLSRSLYHEKRYLCYREFVELSKRIDKIMHPND